MRIWFFIFIYPCSSPFAWIFISWQSYTENFRIFFSEPPLVSLHHRHAFVPCSLLHAYFVRVPNLYLKSYANFVHVTVTHNFFSLKKLFLLNFIHFCIELKNLYTLPFMCMWTILWVYWHLHSYVHAYTNIPYYIKDLTWFRAILCSCPKAKKSHCLIFSVSFPLFSL